MPSFLACDSARENVGETESAGGAEAKLALIRRVSRTRMRASVEEATEFAAELGDCLSLIGAIETTNYELGRITNGSGRTRRKQRQGEAIGQEMGWLVKRRIERGRNRGSFGIDGERHGREWREVQLANNL